MSDIIVYKGLPPEINLLMPTDISDPEQIETEKEIYNAARCALDFFVAALYHTVLLVGKFIVMPVELSFMALVAMLTAIVGMVTLTFKCSLEDGQSPTMFQHLVAFLDELREVACITLKYGCHSYEERIQRADKDPESPEFVLIQPDSSCRVEGATPLLYAPGYLDDPESLRDTCRRIANSDGMPVYIVKYRSRFQSIKEHAKDVDRVAQRIFRDTQQDQLILTGHSMGGLVTGWYIMHNHTEENPVCKLWITIASPLNGTPIACVGAGQCSREMEPESEILSELNAHPIIKQIPALHIYTVTDHVVPYESAMREEQPHVSNYKCPKIRGHLGVRSCENVELEIHKAVQRANAPEEETIELVSE